MLGSRPLWPSSPAACARSDGDPAGGARRQRPRASGAADTTASSRRPATRRASTRRPATSSPPGAGPGRRWCGRRRPRPARARRGRGRARPPRAAASSRSPSLPLAVALAVTAGDHRDELGTPARPSSAGRCSGRCRCSPLRAAGIDVRPARRVSPSGCRSSCSRSSTTTVCTWPDRPARDRTALDRRRSRSCSSRSGRSSAGSSRARAPGRTAPGTSTSACTCTTSRSRPRWSRRPSCCCSRPGSSRSPLAAAGVLLSFAVAVRLSNALIAALALGIAAWRVGPRRTLPLVAGLATFVPVVAAWWPRGYAALFDSPDVWPEAPVLVSHVVPAWTDSLLFTPRRARDPGAARRRRCLRDPVAAVPRARRRRGRRDRRLLQLLREHADAPALPLCGVPRAVHALGRRGGPRS